MNVWNMRLERWERYQRWMRWCPHYFLTTSQRQQVQND